jgi:amidase
MMPTVTNQATALEQAALVRSGQMSAVELVEAALAEIERQAELNAFVTLCGERALAEAAQVRPGDPRPLCGVPIGIKDLLAPTAGVRTTHGSAGFGDWVADHDAPHVARLREAGAILIGKTNTPELGLRPVTEPTRHGATRNPRDPRLSPGGSSGGSAAAVAAGLVALCDGSDFGGSIRIPAACCGVVGLRPSAGLVPNGPDIDRLEGVRDIAVFGPIARTVRDAAAALDVMAGTDRFAAARVDGPVPIRVAFSAPLGIPVDPEPRAAAERTAELLAGLGHDVREEAPDWDDDAFLSAWMAAGTAGMRSVVAMLERLHGRPVDPDRLELATRGWLIDGPPVPPAALEQAVVALDGYAHRIIDPWPESGVLVTPTLTRLPIELGTLRGQIGITDDATRFSTFVRVFNITGQPAITIPVGETTGVQIVAARGRDDLALAVAAQLEEALR